MRDFRLSSLCSCLRCSGISGGLRW